MTSVEYGAAPQQDGGGGDEEQHVAKAVAVSVAVDYHASIPAEARDLTWNDTYYSDEQIDVIAVFDVNYEKFRRAMWCWIMLVISILVFNGIFLFSLQSPGDEGDFSALIWIVYSVFITVLLVHSVQEQLEAVMGLHIAVTKEGIRKDMNKFPFGNMFRTTTIIRYNEMKAIKAQRSCWCCNGEGRVLIQSSEDDTWHVVQGPTDNSDAFVALVNAMIARNAVIIDVENQTSKK